MSSLSKVNYRGTKPERQRASDAGYDMRANLDRVVWIAAGERRTIPLGTYVGIPDGYCGQIVPRSGLASRYGITILNSPGVIDPGYTGEVMAVLHNTDRSPFRVEPGMRIAQMLFVKVEHPAMVEVASLEFTDRGANGLGSSGTN